MKLGLFSLAIILLLVGIRCINVLNDLLSAIVCGFMAILCLWGSFVIDKLEENEELDK